MTGVLTYPQQQTHTGNVELNSVRLWSAILQPSLDFHRWLTAFFGNKSAYEMAFFGYMA